VTQKIKTQTNQHIVKGPTSSLRGKVDVSWNPKERGEVPDLVTGKSEVSHRPGVAAGKVPQHHHLSERPNLRKSLSEDREGGKYKNCFKQGSEARKKASLTS